MSRKRNWKEASRCDNEVREGSDHEATGRKHVRISCPEASIVVHELEERSPVDIRKVWYSSSELDEVKTSLRKKCHHFRQARRCSDCLTQMYEKACDMADAEIGASKQDNEDISQENFGAQEQTLIQWAERTPRGLEEYSSYLHRIRRTRHVIEMKHAVFLEQARQTLVKSKDQEQLAHLAARASLRARSFAALVGKADEWIVRNENKDRRGED